MPTDILPGRAEARVIPKTRMKAARRLVWRSLRPDARSTVPSTDEGGEDAGMEGPTLGPEIHPMGCGEWRLRPAR